MQTKSSPDLYLHDLPFIGKFSLRCKAPVRAALGNAIGLALPDRIGAHAQSATRRVICLGPDEWMLHCAEGERTDITRACADVYETATHSLVDISSREAGVSVSGRESATLLSLFCARDFSKIAVGGGVRTLFDSVQVLLIRNAAQDYHLYTWRSFYAHLQNLLQVGESELATGL